MASTHREIASRGHVRLVVASVVMALSLAYAAPALAANPQSYPLDHRWDLVAPTTPFQAHGLVSDAGYLYLAGYDYYALRFTPGATLGAGDILALDEMATASELSVRDGVMWVVDHDDDTVSKFDSAGSYLGVTLTGSPVGVFDLVNAVTVDASACVYVADMGGVVGSNPGRITKFASDGSYICTFGDSGTTDLWQPSSLVVGPNWHVYVADSISSRISEYSPTSAARTAYNSSASTVKPTLWTMLEEPDGVTVDAAGNVFAVDRSARSVTKFSPDRTKLAAWGTRGTGDSQFEMPWSVAVDPLTHLVFVDDRDNFTLQQFHLTDLRPLTYASAAISVRKGKTATFKFKATSEVAPGVKVTIKIYKGGSLKRTISVGSVSQGWYHTKSWKCTLAKGSYTWKVYANDGAGHNQRAVASKAFTVK